VRHFVATEAQPDGSIQTAMADVTTPSCRNRLALTAAASKRGRITVRLTDRWGMGDVPARACVAAPGRKLACRSVRIAGGRRQAGLSYRASRPGLWSVVLHTAWGQSAAERVYVRPAGKLRLLATGDSMIQYVDTALKGRLAKRGVKVRSDARVSTGLSKPFLLDWPRLAKHQAATVRPDVSVVFLGANDGFPFGKVHCCGDAWVDAYATRARRMMEAYSRQGRGLVYWLTLPAPRPAEWRPVYPAVNRALKRAAATFGGRVRIVDVAKVLTPGNRFRSTMVWHGTRRAVRQDDGIHLSSAGASIAEALIERALRQDGVID
jgi:lysophospholipase L1-like esterase